MTARLRAQILIGHPNRVTQSGGDVSEPPRAIDNLPRKGDHAELPPRREATGGADPSKNVIISANELLLTSVKVTVNLSDEAVPAATIRTAVPNRFKNAIGCPELGRTAAGRLCRPE